MKKLLLVILASIIFSFGCATDCSKCATVVKPKVIAPTIACYVPPLYDEWKMKMLKSPLEAKTEGELFEIEAINVKMMEMYIDLYQNYRFCVEKTIKMYSDVKEKVENPTESKK